MTSQLEKYIKFETNTKIAEREPFPKIGWCEQTVANIDIHNSKHILTSRYFYICIYFRYMLKRDAQQKR